MQSKVSKLVSFVVIALAVFTGRPSFAQQSVATKQTRTPGPSYEDTQWSPNEDLELLKRDLRSQKKQIVAANMNLTDAEAEKFWPVYDRYAAEFAKIYDAKLTLLQEYLQNYQTMSGDQAEFYLRRRAATEEEITQVRLKYVPEFRKVLTGRETVLFYQIDWRLDLMINLQLAQAPVINP